MCVCVCVCVCVCFIEVLIRLQNYVYNALGYPKESNLTQNIRLETEQVN